MMAYTREMNVLTLRSFDTLSQKHQQSEVFETEFRKLIATDNRRYLELELKYGWIAIPNYIYRKEFPRSVVEEALNSAGLGNPQNEYLFKIYPTDFTAVAAIETPLKSTPRWKTSTSTRSSSPIPARTCQHHGTSSA